MSDDVRQPLLYSRQQVVEAERRAWLETDGERYYFDGSHFWSGRQPHLLAVSEEDAPQQGWRHAEDCNCPLCRASRETG